MPLLEAVAISLGELAGYMATRCACIGRRPSSVRRGRRLASANFHAWAVAGSSPTHPQGTSRQLFSADSSR